MHSQSSSRSSLRRAWPWLLFVGAVCAALVAGVWPWLQRERALRQAAAIPVYGALPHFDLIQQTGQPFSDADVRGHLTVVDFFFTRCPTVCPVLTSRMQRVQRHAREQNLNMRFVSFSVDPRHDTPARLTAYAQNHRIDTTNWALLTGPLEEVETAVLEGFRVMMGRGADTAEDDFLSVFHGEHFVLVDASGQLRGYYKVTQDAGGMEALLQDVTVLARAGPSRP